MNSPRPTPRTDAYIGNQDGTYMTEGEIAMCNFARDLERENEAMRAAIQENAELLELGKSCWGAWACHWRTSNAYGAGQPKNHPTHDAIIARYTAAIAALKPFLPETPCQPGE